MNTIIQTPTNKLEDSLDFYKKLGFSVLINDHKTYVTDGKVLLHINTERKARAGFQFYRNDWSTVVKQLKTITKVHKTEHGYLLSDPSNVWIYLSETDAPIIELPDSTDAILGNYMGISLETMDIEKSIELYKLLGFHQTMGSLEQGWIVFTNDDGVSVSFMNPNSCPHLFFNPSLTYFNGKNNLKVIQAIRDNNVPIAEEITYFSKEEIVDNVILRDMGGLGFFVFSD